MKVPILAYFKAALKNSGQQSLIAPLKDELSQCMEDCAKAIEVFVSSALEQYAESMKCERRGQYIADYHNFYCKYFW